MPSMMLTTHYSKYDSIDETCEKLKEAIEQEGWSCPAIRDMNKSMEKYGVHHDGQVRIVELCKAEYADDILNTNPEVSTLMPCAWGVYKDKQGRVCITGMNMGLMGKMFGGNIARIMGGSVAAEEHRMLAKIAKN
ncbi:MAG: DUF302 domain-containing protein [Planctomycetes bacterium]|nr:DUF302 domain-containing protein [Planctomycetota bacterium]